MGMLAEKLAGRRAALKTNFYGGSEECLNARHMW